eukprot:CAMPEP_0172450980 /NCGR_PEP_ID=MMETSP1065-20121228/9151_1 /TAXON_ID=265537 /ORGANISM="Amphiprora paludosa, Strain CCMP125" /LENGTH=172 /DNA_ID=CAMNT_0013202849 /DNA_START=183 /DNA_END=701 /DNA_ORIENTATION=+
MPSNKWMPSRVPMMAVSGPGATKNDRCDDTDLTLEDKERGDLSFFSSRDVFSRFQPDGREIAVSFFIILLSWTAMPSLSQATRSINEMPPATPFQQPFTTTTSSSLTLTAEASSSATDSAAQLLDAFGTQLLQAPSPSPAPAPSATPSSSSDMNQALDQIKKRKQVDPRTHG